MPAAALVTAGLALAGEPVYIHDVEETRAGLRLHVVQVGLAAALDGGLAGGVGGRGLRLHRGGLSGLLFCEGQALSTLPL